MLHTTTDKFGLQSFWLSLQRHLWINTQSEETTYIVLEALSLLMMKVKLKIPPNHVSLTQTAWWKQPVKTIIFNESIGSKHCALTCEGKGFISPPGAHSLGSGGDVIL